MIDRPWMFASGMAWMMLSTSGKGTGFDPAVFAFQLFLLIGGACAVVYSIKVPKP